MMQTIEAEIDTQGRVQLLEKVKIRKKSRALVTILDLGDEKPESAENSLLGSMEILDDNLENGSRQISETFKESIKKSVSELSE